MKLSSGLPPSNIDLFMRLDSNISRLEDIFPCKIGFWHIPRRFNKLADSLARKGAALSSQVLATTPAVEWNGMCAAYN